MKSPPPVEPLLHSLADAMRPHVTKDTVLVGIHTGGVWVAEWLRQTLAIQAPLGSVDVSYHRDDHHLGGGRSGGRASQLPFAVEGAHVVIVDDVLFTGRTIRAAMNELFDYGRPARVDLAVLADRGERQLPICARWCATDVELAPGQSLDLARDEAGTLSFRVTEK